LDDRGNFGAGGFHTAAPKVRVPSIRLDDLPVSDVHVVKIDVEGHEPEVLKGAENLLGSPACWIVETSPVEPTARGVVDLFLGRGHRVYWLAEPFVTPKAPKAPWTGPRRGDLSILAIPPDAPQPEGMVEVQPGFTWPRTTAGFRYLRRFGIRELEGE
jgi:hypothetical protein